MCYDNIKMIISRRYQLLSIMPKEGTALRTIKQISISNGCASRYKLYFTNFKNSMLLCFNTEPNRSCWCKSAKNVLLLEILDCQFFLMYRGFFQAKIIVLIISC